MESITKSLLWRLKNVWPYAQPLGSTSDDNPRILHCLPTDTRDPFGRPIIAMKISELGKSPITIKEQFIPTLERLRLHLKKLNSWSERRDAGPAMCPVFQFIVLLDLEGTSIQSIVRFAVRLRYVIPT